MIPGLNYIGHISNPNANGGQPLPLFEPAGSINTAEGWNAKAYKVNRRSFISANGREPADDAELDAWLYRIASMNT